jgi:hypothetical protein
MADTVSAEKPDRVTEGGTLTVAIPLSSSGMFPAFLLLLFVDFII